MHSIQNIHSLHIGNSRRHSAFEPYQRRKAGRGIEEIQNRDEEQKLNMEENKCGMGDPLELSIKKEDLEEATSPSGGDKENQTVNFPHSATFSSIPDPIKIEGNDEGRESEIHIPNIPTSEGRMFGGISMESLRNISEYMYNTERELRKEILDSQLLPPYSLTLPQSLSLTAVKFFGAHSHSHIGKNDIELKCDNIIFAEQLSNSQPKAAADGVQQPTQHNNKGLESNDNQPKVKSSRSKYKNYTTQQKLQYLTLAQTCSYRQAARMLDIPWSTCRYWKKSFSPEKGLVEWRKGKREGGVDLVLMPNHYPYSVVNPEGLSKAAAVDNKVEHKSQKPQMQNDPGGEYDLHLTQQIILESPTDHITQLLPIDQPSSFLCI